MSYLNRENKNNFEIEYVSILNDWDLDAAFLYSSYPYLSLNIILTNNEEIFKFGEEEQDTLTTVATAARSKSLSEDWDVISNIDVKSGNSLNKKNKITTTTTTNTTKKSKLENRSSIIALWSNTAADKAVSVFQKMMHGFSRSDSNSSSSPPITITATKINEELFEIKKIEKLKQPIGESEYRNFIDSDGRLIILSDLKQRIFDGGCEPSLRKQLWPILLEIYPNSQVSMSEHERINFLKQKSIEYNNLKLKLWFSKNKDLLCKKKNNNHQETEITILASKIQKDVSRTDRCYRFYSGDSNKNIESLFNILLTYSLVNNGFYAQGMSDLLSPLFFVLKDESLAYFCFCSLMKRCASNFDINSDSICSKIELLTFLLNKYDPVFWQYLKEQGAEQLLFVYRWLLIDCKREFPFNDSLRMFEIMWSTIETTSLISSTSTSNNNNNNNNNNNTNNNDQINKSENFLNNFYSRSSSNASSLNLRLFKNYLNRQNSLCDNILNNDGSASSTNCIDDEIISDGISLISHENKSNKTKNSNINSINITTPEKATDSNTTNDSNYLCEYCLASLKLNAVSTTTSSGHSSSSPSSSSSSSSSDSSLDEDCLEALAKKRNRTKWKQNSRLNKLSHQKISRQRYLSLNVFNENSNSKETIVTTNQNKIQKQTNNNNNNNKTQINKKPRFKSVSTSYLECANNKSTQKRHRATSSFDKLYDKTPMKTKSIQIENNSSIINNKDKPVSTPVKFSTSETGTIKVFSSSNQISIHDELKEANSESEDFNDDRYKLKKKIKKSNSHSNKNKVRSDNNNKCKCSKNNQIDQTTDDLNSNKNVTTTTNSSSGIGVNSSSGSSSESSKCSTPYGLKQQNKQQQQQQFSTANTVVIHQNLFNKKQLLPKTNSFNDDEEEELIFSLSKQDNPFLLFICFAIFVENRDHIMNSNMDANDIACYFDKLTRKHNLNIILGRARYLYTNIYLSKTNVFNYLHQLNEIPLNSP
jgi:hypothetical protein